MGGWVDGGGGGYGYVGECPMHTCTHMHVSMHVYVKYDKHGCLHVNCHLQFLYMHLCACACIW